MPPTPLPPKPSENQNPWYATMATWMDGVALNVNELNAQDSAHASLTSHMPVGGTTGQVLAKINSTNFNTQWVNQSGGSGATPPVVFTGTDPATVPLIVAGAASQSAVYFDVQNSAGTRLLQVQADGEVRAGPAAPAINGTMKAGNTDGTRRGFVFNAVLGQSAKLLDLLVNGSSKMSVTADGAVVAPNIGAKVIVLNALDPIPAGTATGTVILRRP